MRNYQKHEMDKLNAMYTLELSAVDMCRVAAMLGAQLEPLRNTKADLPDEEIEEFADAYTRIQDKIFSTLGVEKP